MLTESVLERETRLTSGGPEHRPEPGVAIGLTESRFALLVLWGSAAAFIAVFAVVSNTGNYNLWVGMLVAPALVVATLPLAFREARRAADPRLAALILSALLVKFVGTVVRYYVAFHVYSGNADAAAYHAAGAGLSRSFRDGIFQLGPGRLVGTRFIEVLVGAVYTVIGPSSWGGFFIFAWFGFVGAFLFYRAFCTALPDADHRRYALLVFFLPSLVFWPSSLGKDAWMLMGLGFCALGSARLIRRMPGSALCLITGLAITAVVRPHISAILLIALLGALLFRRGATGATVLAIGVLLVVGVAVANQAASFFGVDKLGTDSVTQVLDTTQKQTNKGGGQFDAPRVRSFTGFPNGLISVLFRPLPTQAHNTEAMIAAAEGTLLAVIIFASWRRLLSLARRLVREPYLVLCGTFTVLFVLVFSSFSNFGILARQRVQLFPFVLAFLALHPRERSLLDPRVPHPAPSPVALRARVLHEPTFPERVAAAAALRRRPVLRTSTSSAYSTRTIVLYVAAVLGAMALAIDLTAWAPTKTVEVASSAGTPEPRTVVTRDLQVPVIVAPPPPETTTTTPPPERTPRPDSPAGAGAGGAAQATASRGSAGGGNQVVVVQVPTPQQIVSQPQQGQSANRLPTFMPTAPLAPQPQPWVVPCPVPRTTTSTSTTSTTTTTTRPTAVVLPKPTVPLPPTSITLPPLPDPCLAFGTFPF